MKPYPNSPAFLLSLFLLFPAFISASGQDFSARAETILESLRGMPLVYGGGKQDYGVAAARLAADPTDAEALAFVAESGLGALDDPFNAMYKIRCYKLAQNEFSTQQRSLIQADGEAVEEWNLDYTENHKVLLWSTAWLMAESFPNGTWTWGGQPTGSGEVMAAVKEALSAYGQSVFDRGYTEFLSPTYDLYKVAAWMNLYDLAQDPDIRAIAEAMLAYHFTLLALSSFEEILLPPYSRGPNAILDGALGSGSQWIHWLFWGFGGYNAANVVNPSSPEFILALTGWRPTTVMDRIAAGAVETPYEFQDQHPFFFQEDPLHVMRTTYRTESYAMSSGVYRMDMNGLNVFGNRQLVHDDAFAIAWESSAVMRYLSVMHPYWNSAAGQYDWTSRLSPFMQVVQHRNAAIVAFDIPAEDPWLEYPILWSGAGTRAETPLAVAMIRIPSTGPVYSDAWGEDWISLTIGDTYIAIKVLQPGWIRDRRTMTGLNLIISRGTDGVRWQTGFLFVCGTASEYPTVDDFMGAVMAQSVSVDWDTGSIGYTTPSGHGLSMQFNDSLEVPDFSVPLFEVDGAAVDYTSWPVLNSPWTSIADGVMEIIDTQEQTRLLVDWSGPVPVFETRELEDPNTWAGYPIEEDGWVYTGDFLGWIYPIEPFVYWDAMKKYLYLPQAHVSAGGAWIHLP
ncbi:MAG: hypothetical protein ACP5I4_06870 [Oceanipulchritudo sp.]